MEYHRDELIKALDGDQEAIRHISECSACQAKLESTPFRRGREALLVDRFSHQIGSGLSDRLPLKSLLPWNWKKETPLPMAKIWGEIYYSLSKKDRELVTHSLSAALRNGIKTVGEVRKMRFEDLLALEGVGHSLASFLITVFRRPA